VPYGENKKKIVFYDTDARHADLKIRLQYHGMTQSSFFRAVVTAMVDEDELFRDFLTNYKEKKNIQKKTHLKKIKEEQQMADENKENFLQKDEISDIFDLIEMEHPDL
tara:strand:- start:2162 stop:2485 length:324 start_codon:yes stop_codon:yes gene_type:complete